MVDAHEWRTTTARRDTTPPFDIDLSARASVICHQAIDGIPAWFDTGCVARGTPTTRTRALGGCRRHPADSDHPHKWSHVPGASPVPCSWRVTDHQRRRTRPSTGRPRPLEAVADHGFHLAAMTERERPQKRPQRRRGHHPMTEHPRGRAGAQHVGVIDVRSAHAQRVRERQHFAPRASTADTAVKADGRVDQRLQTQPLRQRRHQQQARVRDQIRVNNSRVDPVKPMRYSRH